MMTVDNLGLFIASGVLLNLSPGPDVLYIVSQSLRSGVKAGLAAVMVAPITGLPSLRSLRTGFSHGVWAKEARVAKQRIP